MGGTRVRLTIAAVAATVAVGGCGGSGEAGDVDLASFAPAGSPVYTEFVLDPEGDEKDALDSILDRFPDGGEVGAQLVDQLDEELEEAGLTYEEDIRPAIGGRGAFFVSEIAIEPDLALLAEVEDRSAAEELIAEGIESADSEPEDAEHAGVEYRVVEDTAIGLVDDVMVTGTEGGIEAAIETSSAEESMASEEALSEARDRLDGEGALAFGYLDTEELVSALETAIDSGLLGPPSGAPSGPGVPGQNVSNLTSPPDPVPAQAPAPQPEPEALFDYYIESFESTGFDLEEPIAFAVRADQDQVSFDVASGRTEDAPPITSEVVNEAIPTNAWLAISQPDYGDQIAGSFQGLSELFRPPGLPADEFRREFRKQLELQFRRELGFDYERILSISDLGGFARGSGPEELEVGVIAEVGNPNQLAPALSSIQRRLEAEASVQSTAPLPPKFSEGARGFVAETGELPSSVWVALFDGRLTILMGDRRTAVRLVNGEQEDAGEGPLTGAADALGEKESQATLAVRVDELIAALEGFDLDDAELAEARGYLDPLDLVIAGGRDEGSRRVTRFVVTLDE